MTKQMLCSDDACEDHQHVGTCPALRHQTPRAATPLDANHAPALDGNEVHVTDDRHGRMACVVGLTPGLPMYLHGLD
jgi:hypothetical protein